MNPNRWPARQHVAGLHVTEDAPRDEAGDLHARDVAPVGGAQVQRIALVLERRLVQRGIDERAGVVPRGDDGSVHRAAVRMDVEHVHEDADLERVALQVRVACRLDLDDPAVGRREHGAGIARERARRIAEELQDEQRGEPREAPRPSQMSGHGERDGRDQGQRDEQPALAGDDRMRIVGFHSVSVHRNGGRPDNTPSPLPLDVAATPADAAPRLLGHAVHPRLAFVRLPLHHVLDAARAIERAGRRGRSGAKSSASMPDAPGARARSPGVPALAAVAGPGRSPYCFSASFAEHRRR